MIKGQNYQQLISQQDNLEQDIANGCGYKIAPIQFLTKKCKPFNQIKIAKIKPLMKKNISRTSKSLSKLQQEISLINYEKQIKEQRLIDTKNKNNKTSQNKLKDENKSYALQKMIERIDEYNFIIQHRHIKQKNSDMARKLLGINKKSQSEIILQKIEILKARLACKNSIQKTVEINNEIIELYKKYNDKLHRSKQVIHQNQISKRQQPRNRPESKKSRQINSRTIKSHTQTSSDVIKNDIQQKSSNLNKKYLYTSQKANHSNKFSPKTNVSNKIKSHQINNFLIKSSKQTQKFKTQQNNVKIDDFVIMQELDESQLGDSYPVNEFNISNSPINKDIDRYQSLMMGPPTLKMKKIISEHETKPRLLSIAQPKYSQKEIKKNRMLRTLTQVYNKKQQEERSKKLDKYLKQSRQVRQIWQQRVTDNLSKNQKNLDFLNERIFKKSSKKIRMQQKMKQFEQEIAKKQQQFEVNRKSKILKEKVDDMKKTMYDQQKMFSKIIKTKISKFKRIPGTNLIQKNNPIDVAKQILSAIKNKQIVPLSNRKISSGSKVKVTDQPQWMIVQNLNKTFYQTNNKK